MIHAFLKAHFQRVVPGVCPKIRKALKRAGELRVLPQQVIKRHLWLSIERRWCVKELLRTRREIWLEWICYQFVQVIGHAGIRVAVGISRVLLRRDLSQQGRGNVV